MKQHCYIHLMYQETCAACRLADRNARRAAEDEADTMTRSSWGNETIDTSYSVLDTTTAPDTTTNYSDSSSSTDSSASTDSGFSSFDGGSSGGGGSDF